MKILVKAKPHSRNEKVEQERTRQSLGATPELVIYKVFTKESPVDGKANEAIVRLLAKYFHTQIYNVRIISGQTSKQKIVEVDI